MTEHNYWYMAYMEAECTSRLTASHVSAEFGADTDGLVDEILRLRRQIAEKEWTDAQFAHFPDA